MLDGEIVVPATAAFVRRAAAAHPSGGEPRAAAGERDAGVLIVFDLLADADGRALIDLPLAERRAAAGRVRRALSARSRAHPPLARDHASSPTPKAGSPESGATLDGIIAKRLDLPYRSGDRTGMQKIKHFRTADCVVGGFRYATGKKVVGSLLLGLYDDDGLLHHVGFTSAIKARRARGADHRSSKR